MTRRRRSARPVAIGHAGDRASARARRRAPSGPRRSARPRSSTRPGSAVRRPLAAAAGPSVPRVSHGSRHPRRASIRVPISLRSRAFASGTCPARPGRLDQPPGFKLLERLAPRREPHDLAVVIVPDVTAILEAIERRRDLVNDRARVGQLRAAGCGRYGYSFSAARADGAPADARRASSPRARAARTPSTIGIQVLDRAVSTASTSAVRCVVMGVISLSVRGGNRDGAGHGG